MSPRASASSTRPSTRSSDSPAPSASFFSNRDRPPARAISRRCGRVGPPQIRTCGTTASGSSRCYWARYGPKTASAPPTPTKVDPSERHYPPRSRLAVDPSASLGGVPATVPALWLVLPSSGSLRLRFSAFIGTTTRSDSSSPVPVASCSRRVTSTAPSCSAGSVGAPTLPDSVFATSADGSLSRRRRGLPSSWGVLSYTCPALRPRRADESRPSGTHRCCLPLHRQRRPTQRMPFRGSITRPADLLSTLRSQGHPCPRKTRFRLAGQP